MKEVNDVNEVKNLKRGFTLLELLAVVLIIGVLAAIALPQYQVATKVAKIKGLYPVMRALVEARTNYYLIHNQFTTDMNALDVEVPYNSKSGNTYYTNWGWFIFPSNSGDDYGGVVIYSVTGTNVRILFQYTHKTASWGKLNEGTCYASQNNSIANKICAKLGEYRTNYGGENIYLL